MKTIYLPAEIPEFTTYQCVACPYIVAAQNPTAENWYFNNSLQIRCNKQLNEQNHYDLELNFANYGYAKMKEILEYHTLPRELFIDHYAEIISYCLECGYYAYIDCYDEFYLENARLCNSHHMLHDCLITGYDAERDGYRIAVYTKQNHFGFIETSRKSMERALFSDYLCDNSDLNKRGYLCAMKAKDVQIPLYPDVVRQNISDYLTGVPEINNNPDIPITVGIETAEYLLKYITNLGNWERNIDLRISLFYYEHKRFILKLIKRIEEILNLDCRLSQRYSAVVNQAEIMHLLFIKVSVTNMLSGLKKVQDIIERNTLEEYAILDELRKSF